MCPFFFFYCTDCSVFLYNGAEVSWCNQKQTKQKKKVETSKPRVASCSSIGQEICSVVARSVDLTLKKITFGLFY